MSRQRIYSGLDASGGFALGRRHAPAAIASDPGNSYLYVADSAAGVLLGYSIQSGVVKPLTNETRGANSFPAGDQPSAVVVDPSGGFVYAANFLDATVTAYSMSSGALTQIGSYATSQPTAIMIDPSTHYYLYTANFLGSNVSGFQLSSTDGTLINTENTPTKTITPGHCHGCIYNGAISDNLYRGPIEQNLSRGPPVNQCGAHGERPSTRDEVRTPL